MLKLRNYFILTTILLASLIIISSCAERKGTYEPDAPPVIAITSYTGVDSLDIDTPEELEEWLENPTSFQQDIWWSAYDPDGVVEGYAFRISVFDEDLRGYVPIAVPGFDEIMEPDGWVLHYIEGADETEPMDTENFTNVTIWSQLLNAVINFPANGEVMLDDFGNPVYQEVLEGADSVLVYEPVRSMFEVKCIDDSGLPSETAVKYFNNESAAPKVFIASSQGEIDGETVGTGLRINFTILDFDPLAEAEADYFLFKMLQRNLDGSFPATQPEGYDVWYEIEGFDDKGEVILTNTEYTYPNIFPNTYDGDVAQDSTLIVAKAIDVAGIESRADTISFAVKEGFHPGTVIYYGGEDSGNDVWVLGSNHFVTYQDGSIAKVIPNVLKPDGNHFATPFWIDLEGNYTAINSDDLNIYMRWGYYGEYELKDPGERLLNEVWDEETGDQYFTEIIAFDLRLDGEPYNYPPLDPQYFNFTDDDGTEWLRVPATIEVGQENVLYGLQAGEHSFVVRAVDLQLVPDPTPSVFDFILYDPIPLSEKTGVCIIDNDSDATPYCPDDTTDVLYEYFLGDYVGTVVNLDREDAPLDNKQYHFNRSVFSPTDLMEYELIVYHSDYPTVDTNFIAEYDPLYLYLLSGGNMILSGGSGLAAAQEEAVAGYYRILDRFLGIPLPEDGEDTGGEILRVSWDGVNASFFNLQFLTYVQPVNGSYGIIDLQVPSFNGNLIDNLGHGGLGPVSYITGINEMAQPLYTFGCRSPENDPEIEEWDDECDVDWIPCEEQYNFFSPQYVGIKYSTENTNCYTFSFPLAYMDKDQVRSMFNQILTEISR